MQATIPSTDWQISFNALLLDLELQDKRRPRVAVVCIGTVPGAGCVADGLLDCDCALETGRLHVVRAGHAPENVTCELRDFRPDLILLVDTVKTDGSDSVHWITTDCISAMCATTHDLPLCMLARYLFREFNCPVRLLAIQPGSASLLQPATHAIVDTILDGICRAQPMYTHC